MPGRVWLQSSRTRHGQIPRGIVRCLRGLVYRRGNARDVVEDDAFTQSFRLQSGFANGDREARKCDSPVNSSGARLQLVVEVIEDLNLVEDKNGSGPLISV